MANPTRNATVYYSDPFQGNINPASSDGAKLYLKVTAELKDDEKFKINITNAQKFLDQVATDTDNFGWGPYVRSIAVSDTDYKSLLEDHKEITLEDRHCQAYKT